MNASDGELTWNFATGGAVYSSPSVSGGLVYVGSLDDRVYALDASSGRSIWNFTSGGGVTSAPTVADGVVYVGSNDNQVYALNATDGDNYGASLQAAW